MDARGARDRGRRPLFEYDAGADPDDGKIVWYRQWVPGEQNDMDEVFEHILIDHNGRKSLFKMGKLGILWEADRRTGQFLNAVTSGTRTSSTSTRRPGRSPTGRA